VTTACSFCERTIVGDAPVVADGTDYCSTRCLQFATRDELFVVDGHRVSHVIAVPRSRSPGSSFHHPDPDDPLEPTCGRHRAAGYYRPTDPRELPDHYTLCKYCDPDYEVHTRNTGENTASVLQNTKVDDVPAFSDGDTVEGGD
jgi:hypothetical protein